MKKASELGLEVIQLEDQVLLVPKNLEYQTIGWGFNASKGVFWVNSSDRYPSGYQFIASSKPLEKIPLLVIEDEVEKLFQDTLKSETAQVFDELLLDATKHGFINAYKASQKSHPYSEEDLKNYLVFWRKHCTELGDQLKIEKEVLSREDLELRFQELTQKAHEEAVKSLNKKELWIEVEPAKQSRFITTASHKYEPKITNNQIKATWK